MIQNLFQLKRLSTLFEKMHFYIPIISTSFAIVAASTFERVDILPLVYPAMFCRGLPEGQYCNVDFPRELISCPSSSSTICPENHVCREAPIGTGKNYSASCVREISSIEAAKCSFIPNGKVISKCLDSRRIIECPEMTEYHCPEELVCQRRGLRAFCVKSEWSGISEDEVDSCQAAPGGVSGSESDIKICDAVNQRKIVTCPSGKSEICDPGQMCATSAADMKATCVPFTHDLNRFCSNKPKFSSHCIPNDKYGRFIMCGFTPTVFQCPEETRKCFQELSITARCQS